MWFNDDDRASWAFVEGSISVTASILIANVIGKCDNCAGWPVIGFFKKLTEQEDGVIIAGMALLFPTAFVFYLGVKMVFAAYRDYKRWREEQAERLKAALVESREKGLEQGRAQGHEEGREQERARMKRALEERGITLPAEAAQILFGETDDCSESR